MRRTILLLSANPDDTTRLRLDQEFSKIEKGLERSRGRNDFVLCQKLAVGPEDLHRALLDHRPQIIHFAGHSTYADGIILEDSNGQAFVVPEQALSDFFRLFAQIECVFLNACYMEKQAQAISQYIGYVVGMPVEVDDDVAIAFAVAFYDAIGAGETYEFAYKIGCSAMRMHGIPDNLMPIFIESPKSAETHERYQQAYNEYIAKQESQRLKQEREQRKIIADAIHSYGKEIVQDLLERLASSQSITKQEPAHSLSGRWDGMVNGRQQIIEIRQSGTIVHLKGTAEGTKDIPEYTFIGEGRVVHNILVFSWQIDSTKGMNIMTVSTDGKVLDGKYFTAMGSSGNEIYQLKDNE